MSILEKHAIICSEAVKDPEEKKVLLESLKENRDIIEISMKELENYGGNILNVAGVNSEVPVVVMSKAAYDNISTENRSILEKKYDLCVVDLTIIEKVGGGSARCMVAEIY